MQSKFCDTFCVCVSVCSRTEQKVYFLYGLSQILIACMVSRVGVFATPWIIAHQAPLSLGFPSKNTEVGCRFLL